MRNFSRFLLTLNLIVTSTCHIIKRSDDINPLEAVVNRQSQDIAELKATVQALQTATARKAAFHARHPPNPIVANAPIKFVVDVQVGGGYDQTTGVYTAPFSGWYTIHSRLNLHIGTGTDFNLDIFMNNVLNSRFRCLSSVSFTCASDANLHLNAGDRLWIQADNYSGTVWDEDFDYVLSAVLVLPD